MIRPSTFHARRRMRGFSLIEMVAAFLVFAIGVAVLMQILGTSLRGTRQSSDYTMAALWAQSKLDTVGVGEHIEEGRSSGRFDDSYAWELDIRRVDPAEVEPPPQLPAGSPQAQQGQQAQPAGAGQMVATGQAGLGDGLQIDAPFDLYQVDLTVSWGPSARLRTAHFGTLRAVNPESNDPAMGQAPAAAQSLGRRR